MVFLSKMRFPFRKRLNTGKGRNTFAVRIGEKMQIRQYAKFPARRICLCVCVYGKSLTASGIVSAESPHAD